MTHPRVLFINVCLRKNGGLKILPIGLAYVMTLVRQHGFDFDLLDVDINEYDDAYVESFVRDHRYDVVMYGSIVTHYKWVKWLTATIKRYHPDTLVAVGNSVAGSCYEVFLGHAPADIAVIGEGEFTALEILQAVRAGAPWQGIEGIAYRAADGRIVANPPRKACNVNTLPLVDWEFFDVPRYLASQQKLTFGKDESAKTSIAMPVATARGCVFKCTFCHYVFWNDPYRYREPANVLVEIRRDMERYGVNYVNFWDDLSFASVPQVERMVDAILDSGLKFDWMASVRTDLFGHPRVPYERRVRVAEKMRKAGCLSLGFSLESGNPEILKMMNKKVEVSCFPEHVKILRDAGITCNTSVVFGYPIETRETIRETFDMCFENRIYPSIGFLLPLPYTGMYDYAKEHKFITDEDAFLTSITERQDICLNMTTMSDDEIMSEIKTGAARLNQLLELGLDDATYIKTGGYKRHTKLDPENMKRIENDVSFNYSETVFEVDQGRTP